MGRAPVGPPWALMGEPPWAQPLSALLGLYRPGPCGPPWALMAQALVAPWAIMGRALVGPPGLL